MQLVIVNGQYFEVWRQQFYDTQDFTKKSKWCVLWVRGQAEDHTVTECIYQALDLYSSMPEYADMLPYEFVERVLDGSIADR